MGVAISFSKNLQSLGVITSIIPSFLFSPLSLTELHHTSLLIFEWLHKTDFFLNAMHFLLFNWTWDNPCWVWFKRFSINIFTRKTETCLIFTFVHLNYFWPPRISCHLNIIELLLAWYSYSLGRFSLYITTSNFTGELPSKFLLNLQFRYSGFLVNLIVIIDRFELGIF